jgi:hypothetical protein
MTLADERNIVPFRVPGEAAQAISVEGNQAKPRYSLSWQFFHDLARAWQNLTLHQSVLQGRPMIL